MNRKGTAIALLGLILLLSACAGKNITAGPPLTEAQKFEAWTRTSMESGNQLLNIVTGFYQEQLTKCGAGSSGCRFGTREALDDFRKKLAAANSGYQIAIASVNAWKYAQTAQNEADVRARIGEMNQALAVVPKPGEPQAMIVPAVELAGLDMAAILLLLQIVSQYAAAFVGQRKQELIAVAQLLVGFGASILRQHGQPISQGDLDRWTADAEQRAAVLAQPVPEFPPKI